MKALDRGYINIFPMGIMRYSDHAMLQIAIDHMLCMCRTHPPKAKLVKGIECDAVGKIKSNASHNTELNACI